MLTKGKFLHDKMQVMMGMTPDGRSKVRIVSMNPILNERIRFVILW
ncbi:TPA: hypothetical protein ACGN81_002534 [Bacillus cereus]|nr:hypothetical protein [Bacillus wiedmannii]MDA1602220.1 hypothetical protein [Bacillus cereus]SCN09483.1 Protein of unknown function [Bacillus wiedmannii]SCV22887.1 Protein of unknown function [Bacillus cereus]HDR6301545.1 hypothetical protein [Bacillus cereus]